MAATFSNHILEKKNLLKGSSPIQITPVWQRAPYDPLTFYQKQSAKFKINQTVSNLNAYGFIQSKTYMTGNTLHRCKICAYIFSLNM